jgi:hypothetical protein
MKRIRIIVLFLLVGSIPGFSQSLSRVTSGLDLGLGYEDEQWVPAAMYHQELSLNNFSWFRITWGLRTWGYYAGKTNMLPQSSSVSQDTLKFGKISANGASFLLGATIRLWKFELGANTDLMGVAFGLKRKALYDNPSPFTGDGAEYYNKHISSGPAAINFLPLFLDKQNGQSEVFLRYWITERVGLKLGYTQGRMTYNTSVKLDNGHKRFSTTYGVPYAGISFPLYN